MFIAVEVSTGFLFRNLVHTTILHFNSYVRCRSCYKTNEFGAAAEKGAHYKRNFGHEREQTPKYSKKNLNIPAFILLNIRTLIG